MTSLERHFSQTRLAIGLSFAALYIAGMALVIRLVTSVWCLGDEKFSGGCGGWQIYLPLWIALMSPGAIGVYIVATRDVPRRRHQFTILAVGLLALLVFTGLSWHGRWLDSGYGFLLTIAGSYLIAWTSRLWVARTSASEGVGRPRRKP